jgi:hypothetical protein
MPVPTVAFKIIILLRLTEFIDDLNLGEGRESEDRALTVLWPGRTQCREDLLLSPYLLIITRMALKPGVH